MRRRSRSECPSSSDAFIKDNITLSGLLCSSWQMYHTSLLLSPRRKELRSKIEAVNKLILEQNGNKKKIDVSFTPCNAIRPNDNSPAALLVEVSINEALIYTGYFVNWSTTSIPIDQFEALPLALVKAKAAVAKLVNNSLMKVFDFVMSPIRLSTMELASMFTVFVRYSDKEKNGSAELKYTVPGRPRTDMINAAASVRGLTTILDFYLEAGGGGNLCRIFYEKVLIHFRRSYLLDLGRAELRQVTLPDASATDTGRIRMNNETVLLAALSGINSFCPQRLPPPPPMSFPSDSN